ncbi:MAG TPA: DHA2 family efflux MFS transporter permease subunit [Rhizomicrobium sp.]|jgi:DHA2 family multidrug resistance protein|nr:DHA2 family efflux MFS transporter permease subunit [Rhizomicrobium sp.]
MRTEGHSHEAYSKAELRIVMLCSMAGTLMQALDSTIANVALPYMQGSLAASRDQITWVLTSYIVAAAIMTAPVGWIAARFGRKNVAIVSLAGFTVASMLCGAAQSLDAMIVFRLIQGAFGAALSPLSQAIMLDLYPPQKRGQVMAIWGVGVMVGPILGPTLGGYLTDAYDWRWVFYVNLPFGIAAVTGIWFFLRDTARSPNLKFDWFGFAVLGLGLGALQLMLDRGTDKDWFSSMEIVVETVVAATGIYLFLVHMFTSHKSFVPREIFGDRNFVTALVLMLLVALIMLASSALLPPFLENLGGYTVTQTGLLMAPRGIGTMISMFFAGRLAMRLDARHVMAAGTAMLLWSLWEMSHWTPNIMPWWLCAVSFVQGVGMGLIFVPMNLIAFSTLPSVFRTDGSAMFNLMRNVGSAIGVSITTTMLANSIQTMHAELASHVTPFNRALSANAPSLYWNLQLPFGAAQLDAVVQYNAQIIAYANDFLFMFFISLPALLILFLMRKPALLGHPPQVEVME